MSKGSSLRLRERLASRSKRGVILLLFLQGCAGRASGTRGDGEVSDAGASGRAGASGLASASGAGGAGGPADALSPIDSVSAPSVEGDGRLPDMGDTNNGFGWDTCGGLPGWELISLPACPACPTCPTARRGSAFILCNSSDQAVSEAKKWGTELMPQASFFFDEPVTAEGLWFDVTLIHGFADGSELKIWPTGPGCTPVAAPRTFGLQNLFTVVGEWVTACIPLTDEPPFRALGLRIDTHGTLGLDAIRFGPACPD